MVLKYRYELLNNLSIVNTCLEKEFAKFITYAYDEREKHLIKKNDLKMTALPEFVKLFKSSITISRKYLLLK